jgi:hypothetical protein
MVAGLTAGCGGSTSERSDAAAGVNTSGSSIQVMEGSTPTSSAPDQGLRVVDWQNRPYDIPCPGPQPVHVVVSKGAAGPLEGVNYQVRPPVFGTLGGVEVAAVEQLCIGADAFPTSVEVYRAGASGPVSMGHALTAADGVKSSGKAITISDDMLVVSGRSSSTGTPSCCPDLEVTKKFALSAGGIVMVGGDTVAEGSQ